MMIHESSEKKKKQNQLFGVFMRLWANVAFAKTSCTWFIRSSPPVHGLKASGSIIELEESSVSLDPIVQKNAQSKKKLQTAQQSFELIEVTEKQK